MCQNFFYFSLDIMQRICDISADSFLQLCEDIMAATKNVYSRNRRTKHYGVSVIDKLEAVEKHYENKPEKWHNDAILLLFAKIFGKKK